VAAADCTLHPYSRHPPPELGSIRLPPQCGENRGDAPGKLFVFSRRVRIKLELLDSSLLMEAKGWSGGGGASG
jgi:hypothetical protein